MKMKRGSTSVRRLVFIGDSSSTTGAGLANLAHNTAGLVAWYFAGDLSNDLQITLASATLGTYTSGGFVAVDNTNMPGWYEIGIPNAVLDGGNEVAIQLRGAANMLPVNIYIELDAFDYQTATQPVNVTQFGGTNGAFSGGRPEVNATHWGGTAIASAVVNANAVQISGDAVAADNLEAAADGTGYNLGGGSIVSASVTGAVGSVTGAVGSVTGNLGGNVNGNVSGSVGSVTGSVGSVTGSVGSVVGAVGGAVASVTGAVGSVTGSVGGDVAGKVLGGGSGTITGDGVRAASVTGAVGSVTGSVGSLVGLVAWNPDWDAEVQSKCADALTAYDPPTKAEQDAAFTEIKGAGWASSTDTLEKIRDASGGGGGGTTVQINPIAIHTGAPAEAPLMTCHQGEYGNKAYLFYDLDEYGQRSATDFSSYTDLRIGVALPDGTAWIETADITVSANQLTIPIGDLTNDVGTFDATLWDWAGTGATDQRLVVACMQLVVTEAVGADEVVT